MAKEKSKLNYYNLTNLTRAIFVIPKQHKKVENYHFGEYKRLIIEDNYLSNNPKFNKNDIIRLHK